MDKSLDIVARPHNVKRYGTCIVILYHHTCETSILLRNAASNDIIVFDNHAFPGQVTLQVWSIRFRTSATSLSRAPRETKRMCLLFLLVTSALTCLTNTCGCTCRTPLTALTHGFSVPNAEKYRLVVSSNSTIPHAKSKICAATQVCLLCSLSVLNNACAAA